MKFLIDNALSPKIATALRAAGHDAIHVIDLGLAAAEDDVILMRAAAETRILVSADADSSALLALRSQDSPSVILVRGLTHRRSSHVVETLLRILPDLEADLLRGAAVSVRGERVRIRTLPIRRHPKS